MRHCKLIVPPNENYVSEVVVLLTSLGAKRTEFNAGRRVCDLLETKRAHRKILDLNKDVHQDETVEKALQRLVERDQVVIDEDESNLCLPQIFIDGCFAGSDLDLQDLEDDGLLGRILRRQKCVKCHEDRSADSMVCASCKFEFEEILPDKYTLDDALDNCDVDPRDEEEGFSDSDVRFEVYKKACVATPAAKLAPGPSRRSKKEDSHKCDNCGKTTACGKASPGTDVWYCKKCWKLWEKPEEPTRQESEQKEPEQKLEPRQTKAITPIAQDVLDKALARKLRVRAKLCMVIKAGSNQAANNLAGYPRADTVVEEVPLAPTQPTAGQTSESPVELAVETASVEENNAAPSVAPSEVGHTAEPPAELAVETVVAPPVAPAEVGVEKPSVETTSAVNGEVLELTANTTQVERRRNADDWAFYRKDEFVEYFGEADGLKRWEESPKEVIKSKTCGAEELEHKTEKSVIEKSITTNDLDRKKLVERAMQEEKPVIEKSSTTNDLDRQKLVERAMQEVDRLNARSRALTKEDAPAPEDAKAIKQKLLEKALQEVDRLNAKTSHLPNKEQTEEEDSPNTRTSTEKGTRPAKLPIEGSDASRTPTVVETWLETKADGGTTVRQSVKNVGPPESLRGALWKKSPQLFRLRSFDQRYVIVEAAQIAWWNSEKEAPAVGSSFELGAASSCKGFINLNAGGVEIVHDSGNETTLTLKPKSGQWPEGATHQVKGGKERCFTFDTNGTEFSRELWSSAIRRQMQVALLGTRVPTKKPTWGIQKSPLVAAPTADLE